MTSQKVQSNVDKNLYEMFRKDKDMSEMFSKISFKRNEPTSGRTSDVNTKVLG